MLPEVRLKCIILVKNLQNRQVLGLFTTAPNLYW